MPVLDVLLEHRDIKVRFVADLEGGGGTRYHDIFVSQRVWLRLAGNEKRTEPH